MIVFLIRIITLDSPLQVINIKIKCNHVGKFQDACLIKVIHLSNVRKYSVLYVLFSVEHVDTFLRFSNSHLDFRVVSCAVLRYFGLM